MSAYSRICLFKVLIGRVEKPLSFIKTEKKAKDTKIFVRFASCML